MVLPTCLPGALAVFLQLAFFTKSTTAQNEASNLPTFEDTVSVAGLMARTTQPFQDGLAIDILSPKNRTLIVKQNQSPLGAQFVTGNSGEQFVALQNHSYIIETSDSASDLIAKIALPYDTAVLTQNGVQEANTYVATLSQDRKSWIIKDATRNVHHDDSKTRLMKLTSLDGEFMLVGRQTVDTGNIFSEFGDEKMNAVNLTGGPGIQEAEWVDGLKFSVQSPGALQMNVMLNEGVNPGTLPANTQSLNAFMWIVSTSAPFEAVTAQMYFPFNRNMLVAMRPSGASPSTMLTVGRRPLNATSGTFMPFNADGQFVRELPEDRIQVSGVTQLDGQYIILVTEPQTAL